MKGEFAADGGELAQELVEGVTAFEIVDEVLEGYARAPEAGCSAEDLGIDQNHGVAHLARLKRGGGWRFYAGDMANRRQLRDVPEEAPRAAKGLPTMREWVERVGKLEPVATERTAAQVIREERDRLGDERWPARVADEERA